VKISVIIPCFNDGAYLSEAVDSVLRYQGKDVEIIIVNDGSTDHPTLAILENLKNEGLQVISHANKGLAYSRNRGIKAAAGQYILPLDADNRILPDYISKSVALLDSGSADIVYAKPLFIGEDLPERKFQTKGFDGFNLLSGNFIDACAVFRREVWEKTGGFDQGMPFAGSEDWEFWLSSFLSGYKFVFIDEQLFEYRIRSSSMIAAVSAEKMASNHDYVLLKHKKAILDRVDQAHLQQLFYQKDQEHYFRTSAKYLFKGFQHFFSAKS